jgi:tetratricopeptide (TPR) repeat protein
MPHLSQLQEEYGDAVRMIGVTQETEDVVRGFLSQEQSPGKTWTQVIKYRLALDDRDATSDAYMRAAGQNGIPTAFVVGRDGIVEWIGHPMMMDAPLRQIVDGQWDRAAAVAQLRQQEKLQERAEELRRLLSAQQWDPALSLLGELEGEAGPSMLLLRIKLAILQQAGRTEAAAQVQGEVVQLAWDDPATLNAIAWGIATAAGERDLALALKAAERASELQNHKDASTLDTLARVHYEQGNLDMALHWQRQAAEHNTGHPEIDEALKKYEAEKAKP